MKTTVIIGILLVVGFIVGGWNLFFKTSAPSTPGHRSYALRSQASTHRYQPHTAATYTFSIVDEQGTTVKDFATVHEKIMHIIIVRKDLQDFQHLHPEFNQATGQFTLSSFTFSSPGPYRIFADFTPNGQSLGVTLHEDVNVGNLADYSPQPLTDPELSQTFQDYQVQLTTHLAPVAEQSTTLTFAINKNGTPVTNLEKYIGALGHAVVLREGDLEFLHTHALDENIAHQDGNVDFAVTFPTAANYKVFAQFQHQGNIITTDFIVSAESPRTGTNEDTVPIMEPAHSTHLQEDG